MAALTLLAALMAFGANAADGDFVWAKGMGGTGFAGGRGIAVDGTGNVYTTGNFNGTADFDPGPGTFNLTSAGSSDIFVSKLDSAGNFLWAKAMGGPGDDFGAGIAVDNAGNVYTTGNFKGTADFDPGPGTFDLTSAGNNDIFVSKLDSAGNLVWAKAMGGTGDDFGVGIVVDNAGNVYITGSFSGTVDFDPGPGAFNLTSAGNNDIFVLKLDSAGNFVWAKAMGGTDEDAGYGITLDSASNLYVTGWFSATADFDPGPGTFSLTSAGDIDIFVSKLDSAGNFVWAKQMGGGGSGIAMDTAGNVCTTGSFYGTADFDPGPGTFNLTSASQDIFVSKLDSAGNFLWAKQMGGTTINDGGQGNGIAVDGAGNIYTTGWFKGTADFDPGLGTFNLTSAATVDIFVSKLDSAGNLVWAKAIGGLDLDWGAAIAVDDAGNVYTTGRFDYTADFDPGPGTFNLTEAGGYDVFVSKLSCPAPNATIITPCTTGPTSAKSIPFTVVFDKPVQGFDDAADVIVSLTGSAMNTGVSVVGSGTTYSVTVTGISGTGTLTLAVSTASDIRDLANNPLATSVTSAAVLLDPNAPGLPLTAWPLGLALLAAGAAAMHRRR